MNSSLLICGIYKPADECGIELCYVPVFKHKGNYLVVRELVKHVGGGGITVFCLFRRFKPHFLKKDGTELLGGIDIEFPARKEVYARLKLGGKGGKLFPESAQSLGIDKESALLHCVKYLANGYLYIRKKLQIAVFLKALLLIVPKSNYIIYRGIRTERMLGANGIKAVVGSTRLQNIVRKHSIKYTSAYPAPYSMAGGLKIVADELHSSVKECVRFFHLICGKAHISAVAVNKHSVRIHVKYRSLTVCKGAKLCGVDGFRLRGCGIFKLVRLYGELFRKLCKAKLGKQRGKPCIVSLRLGYLFKPEAELCIPLYRCKLKGKVCKLPPRLQLCLLPCGYRGIGERRIHSVKIAVLADELEGGLFSYAGHSGDIIGAIPHQRLAVHVIFRRHSVFFLKSGRIGDQGLLICAKKHRGLIRNKLQAVAVTRQQIYLHILPFRLCGKSTKNIVCLKARLFRNVDAHSGKAVLGNGKLRKKLRRGRFSARLVFTVHIMAEGRRLDVKGGGAHIGLYGIKLCRHGIYHSVYRVCRYSRGRRQRSDPVERTVQYAVCIYYK